MGIPEAEDAAVPAEPEREEDEEEVRQDAGEEGPLLGPLSQRVRA